eukprot:516642-Pelagomonas_calceolata.AAC.1
MHCAPLQVLEPSAPTTTQQGRSPRQARHPPPPLTLPLHLPMLVFLLPPLQQHPQHQLGLAGVLLGGAGERPHLPRAG